jgi:competence protein ComEA
MKINSEPIRNWFGYTRRERRAALILLFIIVLTLVIRYSFPESNADFEDITALFSGLESSDRSSTSYSPVVSDPFFFDPNTATYDTLIRLGLTSRAAGTLINYRSKGGKFRRASDIQKIYGLDQQKAGTLIPWIRISQAALPEIQEKKGNLQPALIELNSCDSALLVTLPGIGPVLSGRIIKFRRFLGGYATVNQLKEVYGLPLETFEHVKGLVFVDSSLISRTRINSAAFDALLRIPYIERYEVTAILKYRELEGKLSGVSDLTDNKLITEEKAILVKPYLSFE